MNTCSSWLVLGLGGNGPDLYKTTIKTPDFSGINGSGQSSWWSGFKANYGSGWQNTGFTSTGQKYGGDGSGSVGDWISRIVYETDQWNPIALAWDGIQGHITGEDRYGNSLSGTSASWKIASAIPIGKYTNVAKTTFVQLAGKSLLALRSTEVGAQSLGKISKFEKMIENGRIHEIAEPIETFMHKGEHFILNGHHRIQAAKNVNATIDATILSLEKAMERYGDKVMEILNGMH
ncbi:hypothetical protein FUA48_09655 [Flavobacterium alkalisoli]|uniref:ParB/Sulfiredoxin domain-containing protein n=1 Tax=Flavobacterium alkalisoli TaxID=2602769 RepID=A0A5B9FS46_9FLAO|nr:hypothetical protein [Flavobacterium alkalisoli]QEE49840.1 hypothetical protein FUA48_09655 [Flavobacterium alkalisoli]